jgi:hypothetical protein
MRIKTSPCASKRRLRIRPRPYAGEDLVQAEPAPDSHAVLDPTPCFGMQAPPRHPRAIETRATRATRRKQKGLGRIVGPTPPYPTSYAARIQIPVPIECASPPAQPVQHSPSTFADRICTHKKASNSQGEEMPYGTCTLDYCREYDYAVGDDLATIFGIGSMIMTSHGVKVHGHVTVPNSLLPDRLLKVFFDGVPDAQIFRVTAPHL